jgi:tetratricopeptide (TPR) repeat protein
MAFWLIPLILMALSLVLAFVIILRRLPQLRVLDVSTLSEERAKRVKEAIILQRFDRLGNEKFGAVGKAAAGGVKAISDMGRRATQRLYRLEQYYQKLKKSSVHAAEATDPEAVKKLLDEAAAFVREGEFIQGEKRYIEVVSHNPKNVDAYEGLGNLYFKNKQYDQARETFAFALRLAPDDASVHMSLADLDLVEGKPAAALIHLRESVEKRPNNPKYLDSYIEASLLAKARTDAEKGIARLKAANPENMKIPDFEARLAALPADPSQSA